MTTKKTDDPEGVERKSFILEIKDETQGLVEAVFATFGVKDRDGDWTEPDAFDGNDEVLIGSWGHGTVFGEPPVGKGTITASEKDARLEGNYFLDTFEGKEQFTTVKNVGKRQEWSYSFYVLETGEITEKLRQIGVRRVLKKVEVLEISPVMRGAGVATRLVAAKSDLPTEPTAEEIAAKAEEERLATEKKAADDVKAEAEVKAQAEKETAEWKARARVAVDDFQRVQRTWRRLHLI